METGVSIPENEKYKLPSNKIYEAYSKRNEELDINSKCDVLTRKISEFPNIYNFCDRLIMNIKYLNTKKVNEQSAIDDCEYLRYWMNDRVINELNVTENNQYLFIISKLIVAWYKIKDILDTNKYICEPTSGPLTSISVDEFKFRKKMYDYYYNYPKINSWELSDINDCSETCKYLTSIKENYENIKSTCSPSDKNKCVSKFTNFDEYHPNFLIEKLGCNTQVGCNKDKVLEPINKLEETAMAEVRTQDQKVEVNTQDSMKNSNRTTILNVALPASVFFVLFPMLYKMTPLGSRFGKANKIRNNIINDLKNEEGEHFLTHAFEQESMNNSDRTYNISYNNT